MFLGNNYDAWSLGTVYTQYLALSSDKLCEYIKTVSQDIKIRQDASVSLKCIFFSFAVSLTKTKKKGLELKTGLVKEVINIICLNDPHPGYPNKNSNNCGQQEEPAILIYRSLLRMRQHWFGLPLRMNGMHWRQFDHAHLDLLPLIIWSCVFWPSVMRNLYV